MEIILLQLLTFSLSLVTFNEYLPEKGEKLEREMKKKVLENFI